MHLVELDWTIPDRTLRVGDDLFDPDNETNKELTEDWESKAADAWLKCIADREINELFQY